MLMLTFLYSMNKMSEYAEKKNCRPEMKRFYVLSSDANVFFGLFDTALGATVVVCVACRTRLYRETSTYTTTSNVHIISCWLRNASLQKIQLSEAKQNVASIGPFAPGLAFH